MPNQTRLEPRLQKAAGSNDLASVHEILSLAREYGHFSASFLRVGLTRSVERGCIETTQYLLQAGADPNSTNSNSNNSTTNSATDGAAAGDGSRPGPLLRAVERNQVRIVQLLLDWGARTETSDKKGRTALMTAAWRNHWHVLAVLIARGAKVEAVDRRRRTVLHNLAADKVCDWGEDVIRLLLDMPGLNLLTRDELGRTPLHWACATGKNRLVEMFLTACPFGSGIGSGQARYTGEEEDLMNARESRGKTALHLAAAHGRDDVVQLLLHHRHKRHQADIEARSDGGWTPLHNASDHGSLTTVDTLLLAGAQVNAQLLNGVTPLHLAAQAGHYAVVERLLREPEIKQRLRDNFGSTAFLRAAQFRRKDVVMLLAPFNNADALTPPARAASEAFDATIVDFGNFRNENRVRKASVFQLLYGKDRENPHKQAFTLVPGVGPGSGTAASTGDAQATDFRWVHLPANNMAWVEALLTKSFIDEGMHDVDGFKGLERSFNYQHRGQWTHSHFMRPLCQATPRARCEKHTNILKDDTSSYGTGQSPSQGKQKAKSDGRGKKPDDKMKKQDDRGKDTNVYMFMPYLHFETVERRDKMQDAIQRHGRPGTQHSPKTRDELLINAHLTSSTTLHIRRTLDQFFYPNINTRSRDHDQVVYRYQTHGQWREPKIFMVDQLWMWILGPNLIVTSFAQRWDQPKNDPLNVLDGVIEDINSKTREPVRSVHDLAITITSRCSGVFDRHRMGDDEYQFLDMFESAIGIATDREAMLFRDFNTASAQASDWLKSHRSARLNSSSSAWRVNKAIDEPLFVDQLLDIGQETDLLTEARDIRDELNMIRTILQHQQHVIDDLQAVISDIYQNQSQVQGQSSGQLLQQQRSSQNEVKRRFRDQQRTIDMHLKDIDRMDIQAERIYLSVTHLLDLKQKHANAFEARFARDQAVDTTRQGKILLVFTIVTIVFLPLSFIATIFDIDLVDFQAAGKELRFSYVAKYIFGVGFAIAIPLIVISLAVDDIGVGCREGILRLRRWLTQRQRQRQQQLWRQTDLEKDEEFNVY